MIITDYSMQRLWMYKGFRNNNADVLKRWIKDKMVKPTTKTYSIAVKRLEKGGDNFKSSQWEYWLQLFELQKDETFELIEQRATLEEYFDGLKNDSDTWRTEFTPPPFQKQEFGNYAITSLQYRKECILKEKAKKTAPVQSEDIPFDDDDKDGDPPMLLTELFSDAECAFF